MKDDADLTDLVETEAVFPVSVDEDTKPWYMSKTIQGAIIVLLAQLFRAMGMGDVDEAAIHGWLDSLTALVPDIGIVTGAFLAVVGRLVAKVGLR